jgi:hypothetical protein
VPHRKVSGLLCRDCGTAMFRDIQNNTLTKGWWGIVSFFANCAYILGNMGAYSSVKKLPKPQPTPKTLLTPMQHPLNQDHLCFGGPASFTRLGAPVAGPAPQHRRGEPRCG